MWPSLNSETLWFWRARIDDRMSDKHSVRPPPYRDCDRGGPGVGSDKMLSSVDDRGAADERARAVFPVAEIDGGGDIAGDDILCSPCGDEEEEAALPGCLPSVYQPTLSEYLDHCVTHYPFRAWCRHC